jgi:hypothetical protein
MIGEGSFPIVPGSTQFDTLQVGWSVVSQVVTVVMSIT